MPSIFDFVDDKRSIYLFDPIFSWTSEKLIEELLEMNSESQEPINIFINSPGGVVTDALGIIDVMSVIKSPINTIILGEAASAASLIAACGDKRYISANSDVMIHEAAMQGFTYLDTRDEKLQKAFQRLEALNEKVNNIYAKCTGKPKDEISKLMKSKDDIYFDAQEAIDFGLVDMILTEEELDKIKLSEGFKTINLSEKFAIDEKDENEFKKVHLLKTCSLKDRGVEITKATLNSLKENFDANVRGQDISIDYTHDNEDGEKKAGAWIKSLSVDGDNLYAMVEFTPSAKKMIEDKEYKYLSVEIDPLYQAEDKMYSNVLLGGTFTNRPAVKGLDPIKLSETINQNKIDMELKKEEISSIEAVKQMGIEIKDFHKSFVEIKSAKEDLEKKLKISSESEQKLKESEKEAKAALKKIEEERIESEKELAVEALIEKGIIMNSHKERVHAKFSSKSEIEEFYKDVPAIVKIEAAGSDVVDGNDLDEAKLKELSKQTGQSVEDIKKFGLKK